MSDLLTGDALAERATLAMRVPVVAALGVRLLDPLDPAAGVDFVVGDGIADNGIGGLHAAVLGAVLELGAYLSLTPHLHVDEHAVTHAIATQLLAGARRGDRVEVRGESATRTRRIGFASVAAAVGDRTIARSQVTKSVVPFTGEQARSADG